MRLTPSLLNCTFFICLYDLFDLVDQPETSGSDDRVKDFYILGDQASFIKGEGRVVVVFIDTCTFFEGDLSCVFDKDSVGIFHGIEFLDQEAHTLKIGEDWRPVCTYALPSFSAFGKNAGGIRIDMLGMLTHSFDQLDSCDTDSCPRLSGDHRRKESYGSSLSNGAKSLEAERKIQKIQRRRNLKSKGEEASLPNG